MDLSFFLSLHQRMVRGERRRRWRRFPLIPFSLFFFPEIPWGKAVDAPFSSFPSRPPRRKKKVTVLPPLRFLLSFSLLFCIRRWDTRKLEDWGVPTPHPFVASRLAALLRPNGRKRDGEKRSLSRFHLHDCCATLSFPFARMSCVERLIKGVVVSSPLVLFDAYGSPILFFSPLSHVRRYILFS